VESGKEPLQDPVPPVPVAVAEPQFTLTAEIGMFGQPAKELDPACTLSAQFVRCEPAWIVQLKVPGEEPDTIPESGLVA
jgi:hypothetical protein